jgi:hypothetical protein
MIMTKRENGHASCLRARSALRRTVILGIFSPRQLDPMNSPYLLLRGQCCNLHTSRGAPTRPRTPRYASSASSHLGPPRPRLAASCATLGISIMDGSDARVPKSNTSIPSMVGPNFTALSPLSLTDIILQESLHDTSLLHFSYVRNVCTHKYLAFPLRQDRVCSQCLTSPW